ncbi:unnamed protein product [Periconia digitata]|uniref:Uncharacterized protein n=1 Tax=Periconia digitata TaxID=1303443 RepID=A0A9W4U2B3_9PLEO|nr:unnamed protein product [Periconia digitata]
MFFTEQYVNEAVCVPVQARVDSSIKSASIDHDWEYPETLLHMTSTECAVMCLDQSLVCAFTAPHPRGLRVPRGCCELSLVRDYGGRCCGCACKS